MVKKVNAINTPLVLLEKQIMITEFEGEIPSIAGLATTAALNAVENKTPNASDLVKKAEYDAKISDIEKIYSTTSEYNRFTSGIVDAKTREKELMNKSDISGVI